MRERLTVKRIRGQALVEVALTLPLLLLLILGAMDFGRMYITKIVLTNAAREGANYLAYYPGDKSDDYAETYARIQREISNSGLVDPAEVSIDAPVNCCTRGDWVEITVRVNNIDLIFGNFYAAFFTDYGDLNLHGTVRMVVQ